MNNLSPDGFDVAIVGFGPVGALAASLLAGNGLTVFVCDKLHDVYDKPRAIALDHEILRVLQNVGVLAAVDPFIEPLFDTEYISAEGHVIKRMTMLDPPYPLAHVPSASFTQPPVEAALRLHAQSLPGVTTALGQTLTRLEQRPDEVALHLVDGAGIASVVRARYAIGCDGATSTVRTLLDIALEDLKFDQAWLVVDVLVNERGIEKLPKSIVQYCDPARPSSFVIGPKNHRRWEISLNDGEDPVVAAQPARTWELLSKWLSPEDGQLWRQASYRFHALVAERWREGRVFIAGDAAHQQPPFLGQGMCQGMRDVANLSWKLAAVVQGRASDSLLDTYGSERKPHVEQLTARVKAIGAVLCERDPERARARDAQLLAEHNGEIKAMPRQEVQPRLGSGFLAEGANAGVLFPQPWIWRDGAKVRLDEVAGAGWRLMLDAAWAPGAIETPGSIDMSVVRFGSGAEGLEEAEGVVGAWFEARGCGAALVRPDHYVYGTAATPAELGVLIAGLRAKLN